MYKTKSSTKPYNFFVKQLKLFINIKYIPYVFFLVCIFLFYYLLPFSSITRIANADATYFARIMDNQTYFYSQTEEDSVMFILPQSYFVELLSLSDNPLFYYARYNDLYGYVKKDLVKPITTTPITPFLTNISFRVFVPSGANLRQTPYNNGAVNLVCSIPFLETNLLYYGQVSGEESISKKGTTWYYCKYYMNNLSYTGYVYAPLTDCLSEIQPNQEIHEYIEGELKFKDDISFNTTTNSMEGLSSTAQTIIIIAVSLPCLLFIYLLFKPTKMAENAIKTESKSRKNSRKKKISRLKHSDYYEFDDDF